MERCGDETFSRLICSEEKPPHAPSDPPTRLPLALGRVRWGAKPGPPRLLKTMSRDFADPLIGSSGKSSVFPRWSPGFSRSGPTGPAEAGTPTRTSAALDALKALAGW